MNFKAADFPLFHDTFNVLDSTKLATFQNCPREFFLSYILGWKPEKPNIHLGFGSAWHDSMELLMNTQDGTQVGYTMDQAILAIQAFNKSFDTTFKLEQDNIDPRMGALSHLMPKVENPDTTNGAKDKKNAQEALVEYIHTYRRDNFRTLFTEVAGTVPVNQEDIVYFKLDSIFQMPNGDIYSMEHKTTGRKSSAWMDNWGLKLQIGTYSHVLNTLYPGSARGVKVNGAILRPPTKSTGKCNNEFIRIPIELNDVAISQYLWEINYLIDLLKWNMAELAKTKASDPIMKAFPRNDSSCTKFGCPFSGICSSPAWANPVSRIDDLPSGYRREYWDPRDRGKDLTTGQEEVISENGVTAVGSAPLSNV